MSKLVSMIAVLALILAACTSNSDGNAEESGDGTEGTEQSSPITDEGEVDESGGVDDGAGGGEPTAEPADEPPVEADTTTAPQDLEGPAPGVTDDSIRIGVTYVDLEAVRDFVDLDQGDYEGAYRALIDEVNDAGGIHGRSLEPVFAAVNPIGTGPAEEICVRMTQDEQVFVTMGFFLNEAPLCWVETYEAAIIGGNMTDDMLARANAPWYSTDPSSDAEADAIRLFAEQGLLDEPFALYSIITAEGLVNDTVLPLLEELGKAPIEVGIVDVPQNDLLAQNAATQVIIEGFRAAGAERILVAGPAAITYANGAAGTDFRVPLLFSNFEATAGAVTQEGVDLTIFEGALYGGPYGPPAAVHALPEMRPCLDTISAAGVDVGDPATSEDPAVQPWVSAYAACRNMTLLTALLDKAGPALNYGTFEWAGDNLGELLLPSSPDPFVFGAPPAADGDGPLYLFEFDPAEADFVLAS